jgi:hypothetical protein
MTASITVDELTEVARAAVSEEVRQLIPTLRVSDLTTLELLSVLAIFRAAAERRDAVAVEPIELKLVKNR